MIGKNISHYKILEKIGSGGMGTVYKAKDTKLDRFVALKFLPPHLSQAEAEKKRFIHEAQAASALDHPNIGSIYEINETNDGRMFIAMACYDGESLKDKISKGPLPMKETLDITTQIARGLEKAHVKKIVHRDIKPANILITEDNVVKIVDFGLAKLAGQTKLTKTGSTLGTVAYMSPEQTTGDDVDRRSDIWSLGVVLYEMLAGRLPFRGHYEQAVVYSILNEDPEPLSKLNPAVPEPLEQIIRKMLAKDPSKRYSDLNVFLEDINRFQQGREPRNIIAETFHTIISKPKLFIPAILFLLMMIIAGYWIIQNIQPGPPTAGAAHRPSLAVVYFDNQSGDKNLDNWREAFPELLTTDLSQSKYLRVLRSDQIYGIYKNLNLLNAEQYSEQDLKRIARNGDVEHILKGSYFRAGDHLVITAMLINARSGETITSLSLNAEGEKEIFSKIDQITREIKVHLNITPDQLACDIDKEVGTISTTSTRALTHYMEGRHHHYEGNFQESIRSMKKALSFDPGFAMAYRSMTWSYYHLGLISEQMKSLKKAMELSENLPILERYVIEADYYRFNKQPGETHDKALESINKALQLYPDNPLINGKLIELCADIEDWSRAIDRFAYIKEKNMSSHFDYHYISIYYCANGQPETAIENCYYYIKNIEDSFVLRWTLALVYPILHKFDLALSEINQARSQAPHMYWTFTTLAVIHLFRGEFPEVENICQQLLNQEDVNAQLDGRKITGLLCLLHGRLADAEIQFKEGKNTAKKLGINWEQSRFASLLGYVYFISGKYDEALHEFEDELEIYRIFGWSERKIRVRYMKAITLLKQNSPELLQNAEDDLLDWVGNSLNPNFERYSLNYLGRKELHQNHLSNAMDYFDQALNLLPHERPPWERIDDIPQVLFIEPLARAHLESGNPSKAQTAYEQIINMTWGRLFYGDLYARTFYQLGIIYQQRGWKGKAIESYKRFIDLWKDCDPVFQLLVEDARQRMKVIEDKE